MIRTDKNTPAEIRFSGCNFLLFCQNLIQRLFQSLLEEFNRLPRKQRGNHRAPKKTAR